VVSGSSQCRSCGRPIVWAISAAGKNIPLDPEPRADGNLLRHASTLDGKIVFRAEVVDRDDPTLANRYVSHFVTCPDAKNFRRPR
jgi:hypothetical protein